MAHNRTHAPVLSTLEARQLEREILGSEKTRAQIMAGILSVALVLAVILGMNPAVLRVMFGSTPPPVQLTGTIVVLLAYELVVVWVISQAEKRSWSPPIIARYMNVVIEISAVNAFLFFLPGVFGALYVPLVPPAFLNFVFIVLSVLRLDFRLSVFTGALAAVEYGLVTFYMIGLAPASSVPVLTELGMIIGRSVIFLIAGVAAAFVSLRVRRYVTSAIQEVEERNRVAGLFGQHVSPEVVEKLLNDPPDGMTEVRDVTVMFLDIRDFTAYSEGKSPEEVMTYLNRLFGMMVESVNQHNGIVNKFLGDGFMAVFGAPFSSGEDTRNAVDAALEIYRRVDEAAAKGEIAPTRIGIGLHAGTAVTGNVGTSARQEYTIIGDVVNVASRIEGLNKQFNSQVLVTHVVWDRLGSPRPDGKSLGPVDVRGHQAIEVFQLV